MAKFCCREKKKINNNNYSCFYKEVGRNDSTKLYRIFKKPLCNYNRIHYSLKNTREIITRNVPIKCNGNAIFF
ncbi:hypothetical protein PUN28_014618 [Cardiocondyla obscurior]|uniref:Uncharacterized protein n=1 Tax=Cardiocondyla obscurior TaxID=286306 RepID=A0AAW2F108_9HYME